MTVTTTTSTDADRRDALAGRLFEATVGDLDLPATSTDYFDDDDGTTHDDAINALAKAGITDSCGTRRNCPNSSVTRGQMAVFLRRAFET
jgi:hypothetical protein